MGVVLNRPSEYTLGEVLFQMGIETASETLREQVVLAGGPVHPDRGFVIYDSEHVWGPSLLIGDGLYLTTSRDVLAAMAEGSGPSRKLWWRLVVRVGLPDNWSWSWSKIIG